MQFAPMKHHEFYHQLPRRARYNLSDACGATVALHDFLDAEELSALASVELIYGSVEGRRDLREGIFRLYQDLYPQLDADDVTVLSGTEEGLFSIMAVILEPGDEVIGMLPCYPSLSDLPSCFGGVFKPVHLRPEDNWKPDVADLAAQITPRTKAIVINSPHNPTGMLLSQQWVDELIALCDRYGLYLIADEVFALSDFAGVGSQLRLLQYDRAVLTNVLSKTFGLPGVRIGWVMTGNAALTTAIRQLKTYNSICQSQLDEQVACFVMARAQTIIDRNNAIVRHNVSLFDDFLAANETLDWCRPAAGIVGLVHSSRPVRPLLADWFERDVLALPGHLFGIEGDYFRVGFGKTEFPQVLAQIGNGDRPPL